MQNICYHVAAFRDALSFDMQLYLVLNFDQLTPGRGGGGTMLLHLCFL